MVVWGGGNFELGRGKDGVGEWVGGSCLMGSVVSCLGSGGVGMGGVHIGLGRGIIWLGVGMVGWVYGVG